MIPIYVYTQKHLIKPYVRNYAINLIDQPPLWQIRIDPGWGNGPGVPGGSGSTASTPGASGPSVSVPGGLGKPSSVAVPERLAPPGKVIAWLGPALTNGA